jgi:hypothetical protein
MDDPCAIPNLSNAVRPAWNGCVSNFWVFGGVQHPHLANGHGGEGTAARCSQAPQLPRYLTWRANRLFVGSRGCTEHCSRRRLLRRAGDSRERGCPAIFTTEQLQRVDDSQHASPRHTSRLPGSERGLCRENRAVPGPEQSKLSHPHAQLHRDWMGACVPETEAGACRG